MKVLFFSRGRGRGHALPDMAIARELAALAPGLEVRFASYGTGAETLRAHGYEVLDLQLPNDPPPLEVLIRASRLIGQTKPGLAVIHEESMAVPASRIFGVPAIFLTEWFIEADSIPMQALHYADEVTMLVEPGITEEPPYLQGRVRYTGRVLRDMTYSREDRERARMELGIARDARLISILPGSWTEARAPIADLIELTLDRWPPDGAVWYWVAGQDAAELERRFERRPQVKILGYQPVLERLMCASDAAITKANRVTVFELAALGVPAVSISQALNPIDDKLIDALPNNRTVAARGLSPERLVSILAEALEKGPVECGVQREGARRAAAQIAMFAHRTALARLVK